MTDGSNSDDAPRLADAGALLRIARDRHHVDSRTGLLSTARVTFGDLCGEPVTKEPSKQRSFSTYMLCNQPAEVIREIARLAAKEPSAEIDPRGAAATCSSLDAIVSDGQGALVVAEEKDKDGRSGHVGIRFAPHVIAAGEPEWRRVRGEMISAFGLVAGVDQVRRDRCG